MISPTAIALAVALPLLLYLLTLLGILLFRDRQLRTSDALDLKRLQGKYAELEELLATFPKAWNKQWSDMGFTRDEVKRSFCNLTGTLNMYVENWIDSDNPQNDSPTRIEGVLFPEPPKHLATDKDTRIFPNPHQYKPAEICTFLEHAKTRKAIAYHIMLSILLHAISFEGLHFENLLPLSPEDILGLGQLKNLIREAKLSSNVRVHISKFGLYYKIKEDTKEKFLALFKSIFEPYFTMKSSADADQSWMELNNVLDAAIQHGMMAIGQAYEKSEYRWGARDDSAIMMYPALHGLHYEDEKWHDISLQGEFSVRAKWD